MLPACTTLAQLRNVSLSMHSAGNVSITCIVKKKICCLKSSNSFKTVVLLASEERMMCSDVRNMTTSSSCSGPRTLLPRCWSQAQCPANLRSLPRLKDAAAAFPFVGSTSNEVEHVSQRDTDRHTHTSTYIHRGHRDTQTHRGG